MNNQFETYYVSVDENDFVKSISYEQNSENTLRPVQIRYDNITDFTNPNRTGLYKVYSDGRYDYPDTKLVEMADRISSLQNLAYQSVQNFSKASSDLQNANKVIVGLTQEIASLKSSK